MRHRAARLWITAGVALAGTSLVSVASVTPPVSDGDVCGIALTAGEEEITLDLVRHGETVGSNSVVGTAVPGPPLDETGQEQAQAVADELGPQGPFAGLYVGENIRMPETAAPLAEQLGMDVHTLSGLNELDGGIYEGDPLSALGGISYVLTLAAWAFGLEFVQMPGSHDFNGVVFEDRADDAVQMIYDNTISEDGPTSDVAFSGQATISAWTLLNVDNPDAYFFLPLLFDQLSGKDFLHEGGIVEVKGDPDDGWTLVSWDGHDVSSEPGLLTDLIVDVRNLIVPFQTAAWHLWEAVLSGDQYAMVQALQDGLDDVATAITRFPQALIDDITSDLKTLFDDLFAGPGDGGAAEVSTHDIENALDQSDGITFGDYPAVSEGQFASALADNLDFGNGDISADAVTAALSEAGIPTDTADGEFVADGLNFGPDDVAEALNTNVDLDDGDLSSTLIADLF
jgi:hypothetical protein